MCGIAGYQGAFESSLLARMSATLAHRGPDGADAVLIGTQGAPHAVGLAHRRLAIIDLSHDGDQPIGTVCATCGTSHVVGARGVAESGIVIVYNGEVYNYRELRRALVAQGHAFRTDTDTEVLLHLYATRGLEMLEALNGIFAFALYDGRERGRPAAMQRGDVLVARDALGVKPLYIAESSRGVAFASELKALLQDRELSRELDPVAIHNSLAYLWTPGEATALRAVRKLEPGHALVLHAGVVTRRWRHYTPPFTSAPDYVDESPDAIAERLRAAVHDAVERQLVADVPVGAFLSGGLDSSAVVAAMRHARPDARPPVCYCIGFRDGETIDGAPADLPYARRVARHLGVELREIEVEPTIVEHLERLIWLLDEPQADPAPINALLIAEQARRDGITVLLSGAGGDDIFSGYRRHAALAAEGVWAWLPAAVRRAIGIPARAAAVGSLPLHTRSSFARRAVKALAYADRAPDDRLIAYFWWSPDELRRPLYNAALTEATRDVDTAEPLRRSLRDVNPQRGALDRMLYLEQRHFLADHNLNYTDKTGMAAGVEVRVPLLDLELVKFAARIPPALKQRGGEGKWIFKKAMERDLPRDVIWRKKSGFGAPLRRWLREELRDRVEDLLSPASLRARGLFDASAVGRLIALDRAGAVDGSYTIFALMCMELWCRTFVDAPASMERAASPVRAVETAEP